MELKRFIPRPLELRDRYQAYTYLTRVANKRSGKIKQSWSFARTPLDEARTMAGKMWCTKMPVGVTRSK